MDRLCWRFVALWFFVLVQVEAAAYGAGPGATAKMRASINAATERGLDWIEKHPASVRDGGLPDMLDEALGFRVLSTLPGDPAVQRRFRERFTERMSMLSVLPEFRQWVNAWHKPLIDHYHLVLAACLMQDAGIRSDQRAAIVTRAQQALANSPYADPTKRLTTALLLQRLDEKPAISLSEALAAGRIGRVARGVPPVLPNGGGEPWQRRAALLELYALVHEIVALTDFGNEAPPPWLGERLQPLNSFLVRAIAWAGAGGHVDLLSELLLTARFIGASLQDVLPEALQMLLSSQRPDGSWGEDLDSGRANKSRHAVFTATTALWAFAGVPGEQEAIRFP